MSKTALFLNDFDTSGLGLMVTDVQGWLDSYELRDKLADLPGRLGQLLMSPSPVTVPRQLIISGVLRTASNAVLRASCLDLVERAGHGLVEVRFVDDPLKVFFARLQTFKRTAIGPALAGNAAQVMLTMLGEDPLIYSTQPTVAAFGAYRGVCPLGSAPSAPVIHIFGPVTNPVLRYRGNDGELLRSLTLTVVLASTDYLEIDSDAMTIVKYVSGVPSNGISLLTSGDFIVLDPNDGDYQNGSWPTLEVSGGTGEALYRQTWI